MAYLDTGLLAKRFQEDEVVKKGIIEKGNATEGWRAW